ncbi:MAG TPA: hypothetical protein VL614_05330 [Acetobacteraceae bacterium]|jgi:hypothetical protein|nr:hypothetical protein [Acetobacteraceae bacterium]
MDKAAQERMQAGANIDPSPLRLGEQFGVQSDTDRPKVDFAGVPQQRREG